jgi:hypothetical protein
MNELLHRKNGGEPVKRAPSLGANVFHGEKVLPDEKGLAPFSSGIRRYGNGRVPCGSGRRPQRF